MTLHVRPLDHVGVEVLDFDIQAAMTDAIRAELEALWNEHAILVFRDQQIDAATLGAATDANFSATVEILAPGTTVTTESSFVPELPTEWTFENGAIQVTIGEGTDLNEVGSAGGSLVVEF